MKLFKKLALLCTALTLTASFAALASCGGKGGDDTSSSSAQAPATAYTVTVLNADGSKAQNVNVQLCYANGGACIMYVPVDANGTAVVSTPEDEYVVHVWDTGMTIEYNLTGDTTVADYGSYTVQIAQN